MRRLALPGGPVALPGWLVLAAGGPQGPNGAGRQKSRVRAAPAAADGEAMHRLDRPVPLAPLNGLTALSLRSELAAGAQLELVQGDLTRDAHTGACVQARRSRQAA